MLTGSKIDARGSDGGGTVLVGGGWQGKNKQISHADAVVMESGANIDASASRVGAGEPSYYGLMITPILRGRLKPAGGHNLGAVGKLKLPVRNC
ncbi:hypothetical protein [Yersinia aleksiciae]|uniref:hypothetical protein n=1 Tax=Yersinia aleksiciae TaxID=263819 RepID=UPI0039903A75